MQEVLNQMKYLKKNIKKFGMLHPIRDNIKRFDEKDYSENVFRRYIYNKKIILDVLEKYL